MKVAVWDTYVEREDGKVMHFDILVPNELVEEKVIAFGQAYLKGKPFKTRDLTTKACRFCHVEQAPEETIAVIQQNGFCILEMNNCD